MDFQEWLKKNPPQENEAVIAHPFSVACICLQTTRFVGCVCNCHFDITGNKDQIYWAKYGEGQLGCL